MQIDNLNIIIYEIRESKVMLDSDLAILYGVETKVLNQAVKRNIDRFPKDFMFHLSKEELEILRSQFVTTKFSMTRSTPYVFTEQGIAMLSSVLRSKRAIEVNIYIMRTFVQMRKYAFTQEKFAKKLQEIEKRVINGEKFDKQILEVLSEFMKQEEKETKKIGFV